MVSPSISLSFSLSCLIHVFKTYIPNMFSYERSLDHHLVFVNRQNGTCSSEEKKTWIKEDSLQK